MNKYQNIRTCPSLQNQLTWDYSPQNKVHFAKRNLRITIFRRSQLITKSKTKTETISLKYKLDNSRNIAFMFVGKSSYINMKKPKPSYM